MRGQARPGEASRGLEKPGKARKGQERPAQYCWGAAMRKTAEGLSKLRGRPSSPRGGTPLHHTPPHETTMETSTHCPYSCLRLGDTYKKAGRRSPPACCVTGPADAKLRDPKWTPNLLSNIMFSIRRAQFGDPFWFPFVVPAGVHNWSPKHSK